PAVQPSSVETFTPQDSIAVLLRKHDVIVLGGLLREKELERTSKIPLLGDLPFLGFIFRSENRLILRTEYIIFLIPDFPELP
ncbi:MAG TPA: pilus (MSHA type) biogenesis protein MshL, partial [Candidatus Omnitrophota bacterium]|nr:pilus (MSHA type) biogenesis protein MshL [Candidatus Omnitrophota bacterium]